MGITSGEWVVIRVDDSYSVRNDDGFIAKIIGRDKGTNARLIALSPLMYEALGEVVTAYNALVAAWTPPESFAELGIAMCNSIAVLSKAEGK